MESVALPKVTPYLLRRADSMCARRLAEEVEGGTRSDDPVNRARLREVFLETVRNAHADMRAPVAGDFDGIGHDLWPEEQAVLAQAARWYVQLFGARPAILYDHGLDQPTESPRRGLRIGGWVDLTLVAADGGKELRQFDLWCGRVPNDATDLESVRLAVLRLSRWMGDDPLRVVWTDLVRGNQRETVVDASTVEELRHWFDERVTQVRQSVAQPDAVNGPDCGQCNFVAGCPQHGSWHGRARGQRNDFRPPILRLSPSSLASWHRCPREWRNTLLVVPSSDAPGPTHYGDELHALLKLVHEEGSCQDDALVSDVLVRHGADGNEQIRAGVARHTEHCPQGATALGHEMTRARFQFRPGPPFMASARIDALWKYDDVLDAHDYKTGRAWDHRLSDDTQARVQAWILEPLARSLGLRLRISFEYLSPEVTTQPDPFEPEAEDLEGIELDLRAIAADMRAETEFAGVADPETCGYCRYRSICPDSAARSEPVWPAPDKPDTGRSLRAGIPGSQPFAPSKLRMLWWGATKRCPRCGSGHLFRGWFTIVERCPRCGLHFERESGYWTGALAINIAVTTGVFALFFVVALALTIPDVPVAPLLVILVPLMIIVPIAYYPFSKTVWMAFDRAVLQHLDPNERVDQKY